MILWFRIFGLLFTKKQTVQYWS